MQELDPKILGKIKKCLALSASDNPNEAATAMRQAHALMEKHGVTAEGIVMGDIGEAKIKSRTMARNKPEQWEAHLASTVGRPSTLHRATCTLYFSHPGDSSVGLQGDSSTAIPDVDSYSGQDRDAYIDSVPDTLRGNLRSPWGAPIQCTTKN
jgi:hypothetical protein